MNMNYVKRQIKVLLWNPERRFDPDSRNARGNSRDAYFEFYTGKTELTNMICLFKKNGEWGM